MFYLDIKRYTNYVVVYLYAYTTNRSMFYYTITLVVRPLEIHYDSREILEPQGILSRLNDNVIRRAIDENVLIN